MEDNRVRNNYKSINQIFSNKEVSISQLTLAQEKLVRLLTLSFVLDRIRDRLGNAPASSTALALALTP
ncbi:hypothetical protein Sjap_017568 [Stephania japonica]|uniref:Uncharacterized protein n=1 Tax=Stephania japonica TaxID=461633 RepID=A0AAP0NJL1_9MAGN